MLGKTLLVALFDYNAAMNARLLAFAAPLTDAQLDAPTAFGRSLRETLLHTLLLEWVNRTFTETHAYPVTPPPVGETPAISELQAFAGEEAARARAYLDAMSEEALLAPVAIEAGNATLHLAPWEGLAQLLMHTAQHRSEIAAMLTQHRQSPGDIDFVFFAHPEMRPAA